ncbi:MAG TPA: Uma2 family endonuclease [Longimicrobiales bacterium]|nr:Uma2 family endonuclease [Longimicrobiales bacterium]
MSTNRVPLITPAEYLEAERRAETKSEYFAGQVFALAGASKAHNLIVVNLVAILHGQLKGQPCEVYPSDMRIHVRTGLYTYPDVSVVCGTPQLEDEHFDTLLNPTVLIEVVSDSTERYDRGRKAEHYRQIESLQEYLLAAQDKARIERYRRQGEREWVLTEAIGLEESVPLDSVGCVLPLRDVYDRVI